MTPGAINAAPRGNAPPSEAHPPGPTIAFPPTRPRRPSIPGGAVLCAAMLRAKMPPDSRPGAVAAGCAAPQAAMSSAAATRAAACAALAAAPAPGRPNRRHPGSGSRRPGRPARLVGRADRPCSAQGGGGSRGAPARAPGRPQGGALAGRDPRRTPAPRGQARGATRGRRDRLRPPARTPPAALVGGPVCPDRPRRVRFGVRPVREKGKRGVGDRCGAPQV